MKIILSLVKQIGGELHTARSDAGQISIPLPFLFALPLLPARREFRTSNSYRTSFRVGSISASTFMFGGIHQSVL